MRRTIVELFLAKWLWITIFGGIACLLSGFVLFYMILLFPSPWRGLAVISIVIAWGVVSGYKDWRLYRSKEEKVEWHSGKEQSTRSS